MSQVKNMLNKWSRFFLHRSAGLLLIRVAVGVVFLMHGWGKIHNIGMAEGMMANFGLGAGTGIFIAWLEVLGGIAMILGILTRVFGVLFGVEMLVAVYLTSYPTGFVYMRHESEIFLMLVSFGLALAGSGKFSLWKMECDDCGGMLCDSGKNCPVK